MPGPTTLNTDRKPRSWAYLNPSGRVITDLCLGDSLQLNENYSTPEWFVHTYVIVKVHGWFPHEYSHSHYAGDVDLASIHREVVLQWRILLVQTRQDVESTPQNKIAVLHSTNAITGPDTRRAICAKYICMGDAETARSSAFL